MIYRTYGSTGIEVSAIGFGGMRFKDVSDVDGCASLVRAAYEQGINYFDTAPGYEKSEELFGVAFKQMNKTRSVKPFYVSTKSSKAGAGQVRRDLETSLKRMNLDYIDFYHLWCVLSLDDYKRRKTGGAVAEFERLKAEGLIRHICVSTHMTGPDISRMLDDYPFEGVLLGYSAMNFAYREAGLDAAARLNRGVVIMNPLGGGIIPQHPERFGFVKTRPDETVVEAALRFLLNDRRITIVLVGLSSRGQLTEAISAVDGYRPIPKKQIQKIRAGLNKSFNELCTSCRYCDSCPQGIAVPELMDAYNHYVLVNSTEMLNRLRFNWDFGLENTGLDKCTECGLCEEACTQKLPIRRRMKFMHAEVQKFLTEQTK
jgi:predicted aldo/keto reductase-like oxidoreductase